MGGSPAELSSEDCWGQLPPALCPATSLNLIFCPGLLYSVSRALVSPKFHALVPRDLSLVFSPRSLRSPGKWSWSGPIYPLCLHPFSMPHPTPRLTEWLLPGPHIGTSALQHPIVRLQSTQATACFSPFPVVLLPLPLSISNGPWAAWANQDSQKKPGDLCQPGPFP